VLLVNKKSFGLVFPTGSGEAMSSVLDNSLTNIQWLGKMRTDGLTPCSVKQGMEKENQIPLRERMKVSRRGQQCTLKPLRMQSIWIRRLTRTRCDNP